MNLDLQMNEDLRQQWIAALRSGKYKQATGTLKDVSDETEGYCCLGVLADISKCGNWQEPEYDDDNGYTPQTTYEMDLHGTHYTMTETLWDAVLDEFGIPSDTASLLMSLNDGGMPHREHSFDEIAQIIENGEFIPDDENDVAND